MSENTTSQESWDGLLTNYLKAEHIAEGQEEEVFVVTGLKVTGPDLELDIERTEGEKSEKFVFGMNTTNKVFLKKNGIKAPKDVIGKKLTMKKVVAYNPTAKKEVPSLRISKVE